MWPGRAEFVPGNKKDVELVDELAGENRMGSSGAQLLKDGEFFKDFRKNQRKTINF